MAPPVLQPDQLSDAGPSDHAAAPAKQFSLRALLWAIALLALILAPIANFGWEATGPALYIALVVALLVTLYRSEPNPKLRWLLVLSVLMLAGVSAIAIWPAFSSLDSSPILLCPNNIRNVRTALEEYAKQHHGKYPPASVPGPDGSPWHSWRTLILPYMGEQGRY